MRERKNRDRMFIATKVGFEYPGVERGLRAKQIEIVLAWMVQSDPPVIPLVAASTAEQMRENLDALEIELSAEQMARLNNASA